MTCAICFDEMDMQEFKDEKVSTDTCFKLDCGHAYHTKCIVRFLTDTVHKCPTCNKHKTPEQQLGMEGLLRNYLREIKRDPRFKIVKSEYVENRKDYIGLLSQLKKETKVWVKNRAAELKIPEHKSYYLSSTSAILSTAKEIAREKNPTFLAAVESDYRKHNERGHYYAPPSIAKTILFGKNPPGWRDWKLRNPRVWATL
jgi:hypothetical protein